MKKVVALVVCFCLFVICCPVKTYAGVSITQRVQNTYYKFVQNEKVLKFIKSVQAGWDKFKNWVANLPGIKDYNDSIYSDKNWKKTMGDMGLEYNPHLKGDSAGAKMLKEGKKNWDNL